LKLFTAERPATLDDVAWIRKAFARRLAELRLPSEIANEVLLSISELATNIVLHGNPSAQGLRVEVALEKSMLRMVVTDDGGPFNGFNEAWANASLESIPDLAVGGRGIALAKSFLDTARYREGPPNVLAVQRRLVRQRPQILVVEDDPVLLATYSSLIAPRYRVRSAETLQAALKIANETTIDLILTDLHLGTEMGTALVRVLEDDAERPPIPFIMVTADPDARKLALELGVETFLLKPVAPTTLIEAVDLALMRAARRRARLFHYFSMSVDRLIELALPKSLRGFVIAAHGESADVGGGDLAIHVPLPDRDRIVLVDVMGHGIAARAGAVAQAAIIRALHAGEPLAPGVLLTRWSGLIHGDNAFDAVFVTALVVDVFDGGMVEIACAGHPHPVRISPAGSRPVVIDAPLLGFAPDPVYESIRLTLAPGERLLLVTDGFDPGDLASGGIAPDWLIEPMANPSVPLAPAASAAAARALSRLGMNPQDDWTFVVLEYEGTVKPASA